VALPSLNGVAINGLVAGDEPNVVTTMSFPVLVTNRRNQPRAVGRKGPDRCETLDGRDALDLAAAVGGLAHDVGRPALETQFLAVWCP
jgi:hypothetical protein